jgi:hypothetical protein
MHCAGGENIVLKSRQRNAIMLRRALQLHWVVGLLILLASAIATLPAHAIQSGRNDANTPEANAVGRLYVLGEQNGTATLVAPNLVLTAGHVVTNHGLTNSNEWHNLGKGYEVVFGYSATGVSVGRFGSGASTQFIIHDKNGGSLRSGDEVNIETSSGWFITAQDGYNNYLTDDKRPRLACASGTAGCEWQTFHIERVSPGFRQGNLILSGDTICLKTYQGSRYVAIDNGDPAIVYANRPNDSDATPLTFRIVDNRVPSAPKVELTAPDGRWLASFHSGGAGTFRAEATAANTVKSDDIMLLRLDRAVPRNIAVPARVLAGMPKDEGGHDPSTFWAGQRFKMVGWGAFTPASAPSSPMVRQMAPASNGAIPWRDQNLGSQNSNLMKVTGVNGANVLGGDSGGPLFWSSGAGSTYLVGICQGVEANGGRYTVTFGRGGWDSPPTMEREDIAKWLQSVLPKGSFGP